MKDVPSITAAADIWGPFLFPWAHALRSAPDMLNQPINPGWAFGNVVINERNSSAPETEQAILAEESYGRQIGKLLDAVCALIRTQPGGDGDPAFGAVVALRDKVEGVKREAAARRVDQFRRDLTLLKSSDRAAYDEAIEALRAALASAP